MWILDMASLDMPRLRLTYLVVASGIAGTLDLAFAMTWAKIMFGVSPEFVLQVIASGLFGPVAISGGWLTSLYGALIHYLIMIAFAAFAWWTMARVRLRAHTTLLAGLVYGAALFAFMNYIVVPASSAPIPLRTTWSSIVPELLAHMLLVGAPLVCLARRELRLQGALVP